MAHLTERTPSGPVDVVTTARAALDALRGGEPVVAVVVIAADERSGAVPSELVGRRLLVWASRVAGTLADPALDDAAAAAARELLEQDAPQARELHVAGRTLTLYLEPHRPTPRLVIVGAGHIARPLCRIGALLGFAVTVLDDRPEFATGERFPEAERVLRVDFADPFRDVVLDTATHLVLVTRGHRYDYEALRDALRRPVRFGYLGLVGSQRRVRAALEHLLAEGIPRERLHEVHAPIGLDIGAETPAEIAVAIAAEIVLARRGGTGRPLRDRRRVVERWLGPPPGEASPPTEERRTS